MNRNSAILTPAPSAAAAQNFTGTRLVYDGRFSLLVVAAIWTLTVFMIVPEGFKYGHVEGGIPTEGSPMSRAIWLALLAFGILVTLWRLRLAIQLSKTVNVFLLIFIALAALSVLWSIEPTVTLRRIVRVVTIFFDAVACSLLAWQPKRFQQLLRPILTLMLAGSIVFVLMSPTLAIEQLAQAELVGAWHGLATQKNGLGSIAGTALVLWVHAWLSKETRPVTALIGGAIAFICLVRSRSSTSIMAATFTCTFLLMLLRTPSNMRRYMPYIVGAFAVILVVYSLAVLRLVPGSDLVLAPIASLTGKDQTFSGRTAIWAIITDHIQLHPLLGTGYGAYWIGEVVTSPSYETLRRLYFYPTESHNGYLDVINDLGYVGGVCLIGYVIVYIRQALKLFSYDRSLGALYLALVFQQLIANLSESRWFNVLTIEFVIATLAAVSLGRCLLQMQFDQARQPVGTERRSRRMRRGG